MTGRILKIGVPVALLALVVTAWAAHSPERMAEKQRTRTVTQTVTVEDTRYLPLADGPRHNLPPAPTATITRSILDDRYTAPKTGLQITAAGSSMPIVTPITVFSATTYDYQHNDDGTRQIQTIGGSGNHVHFAITYWDVIPDSLDAVNRYVTYNAYNTSPPPGVTLGANGDQVSDKVGGFADSMRAGFVTLDVNGDDLAAVSFHARGPLQQPSGTYSSWVIDQGFPGLAIWAENEMPASVSVEAIWPHVSIDIPDEVYHVTCMPFEVNDRIQYYRRITQGGGWTGPILIDETTLLNYHAAPDPTSGKVSIAYLRDQENPDALLDVLYVTSANNGSDWIAQQGVTPGVPVGPAVGAGRQYVTNYTLAGGSQAWVEVTSEYDLAGVYHVLWIEQVNANLTGDARVRHWDNSSGNIRTVAQGIGFGNVGGDGGRDIWLAYPQIGFGDGSTDCSDGPSNPFGGNPNSNRNYLYVTYEQYGGETAVEANDASVTPQMNLEVYLASSNDGGNTWSPSVNLTSTKTPGCDGTIGNECASERDPSIARIINDTIHVMYILDTDAGDAVFGQGIWTYNPVHYLRIPGGDDVQPVCPQIAANFASGLSNQQPGCEYNAPRGGSQVETLTIENLGNATLSGNVSKVGGAAWLQLTTGAYNVAAGAAANTRPVTMNASVAPLSTTEGLYQETISITHNDPNKVSPRLIPVDFFVFDEFYCAEFARLHTNLLWLEVGSIGEITRTNDDRGGLARLATDTSWSIYDGSVIIGVPPSPDTLVYMYFDNSCPQCNNNKGYRALSSLEVDSSSNPHVAKAKATTFDSTLGLDIEYVFPQSADSAELVLVKYKLYNRTGGAINDLIVGHAADFDVTPGANQGSVQPGSQNTGHLVSNWNMLYQQGIDTTGHVIVGNNTATRFQGGMSYVSASPSPRGVIGPNDPLLFSRPGGYFHEGYLYQEITKSGFELVANDPNPGEDLHSVLVFEQNVDLAPDSTRFYVLALVSSDAGFLPSPGGRADAAGLTATIKKAWRYAFGWGAITTIPDRQDALAGPVSAPVSTQVRFAAHAVGSHADGLGGGGTGCTITEQSDPGNLFSFAGSGCRRIITFAGANNGCYRATYRVANPGGYTDDVEIAVEVGTGDCSTPSCSCPFQGNINGDGVINATDLTLLINIVFFGGTDPQDPLCPKKRGNFNNDGVTNATDLTLMINHIFFGGPGPANPCA